MIAPLELVKGMALTPQACVLCANNPVDELSGEQQEAIFAPGVDVNWGNSVYICKSCGEIVANLLGRVSTEENVELREKYEVLLENFEALEESYRRDKLLLDRIRDGRDAVKEVKQEEPSKKRKAAA